MEFGQIETFLAIAQEGGFSRAAEKLGRTQPALSISIKRLEEELGEALFERSSRGGTLTGAGQLFLAHAQSLMNQRAEVVEAFKERRGLQQGNLSIGANESTSLYLLPPLLLEYRKRHPEIRIRVHRAVSERIPQEVLERNLDFGFLSYDPVTPDLKAVVVHRDHMVMVVPKGHRLAKSESVGLQELGQESFLAHNARTPARDSVVRAFAEAGVPLRITMELSSLSTICDFVGQGVGLAILPSLVVRECLASGSLVALQVPELQVEKVLRMIYRRESYLSSAAQAFLELVRSTEFPDMGVSPISKPSAKAIVKKQA